METIRTVFQDFNLVKGTWDVCNVQGKVERVRPEDIRGVGLITVEGELDDISGLGQTKAAHGLCKGIAEADKQHLEVKGAGHYGIFSGRRWREIVYPAVRQFLAKRQKFAKTRLFIAEPSMMCDDHQGDSPVTRSVKAAAKTAKRTSTRKAVASSARSRTASASTKSKASTAAAPARSRSAKPRT